MTTATIPRYRTGRNWIRVGDVVKVAPSKPRRHDGGRARVLAIRSNADTGDVVGVDVVIDTRPGVRTLTTDRIHRVAQTKAETR